MLDLAEQLREVLELREQQQPRVRRQQLGDSHCRGMCAVRRAECVVHVEVASCGELACEPFVVRRFPRIEAGVLAHLEPLVRQQLAQAALDRRHGVPRTILVRLRPPEMRADANRARATVEEQAQRRERGPDPRVVGDLHALEWDVQVGADENDLPRDVRLADGVATGLSQVRTAATLAANFSCYWANYFAGLNPRGQVFSDADD